MWKTYPIATCLWSFTNFQFCSFFSWILFFFFLRKPIRTHNAQISTEEKAQNRCFFQLSQTVIDRQNWAPALSWRASLLNFLQILSCTIFNRSFQIRETVTQIPVSKITPGKRKSLSEFYAPFFKIPVSPEGWSSASVGLPFSGPSLVLESHIWRTIVTASLFHVRPVWLKRPLGESPQQESLWPRDASDLSPRAACKALGGAHSDIASHCGHHCRLQGLPFPLQGFVQFPMPCELNSFPSCQISKSA